MNELIETPQGSWNLVVGPYTLRNTMQIFIACLAENGPVRVWDGGNHFNAYFIARELHGQPNLLERITISRMFTCYQVLESLENAVSLPVPFVVLDFLRTFYDESVPFSEHRRLVIHCIPHLERLSMLASGAIIVYPPAIVSPEAEALLNILKEAAPETWTQDIPKRIPVPLRLF